MEKTFIRRDITDAVAARLGQGKAIVIYGARQVGKTTFVRHLTAGMPDVTYFNGDERDDRARLSDKTSTELRALVGSAKTVVIDEAQRIENVGLTIKLFVDTMPDVQVIATGSSSFELANKIREPLTGRAFEFHLHPFSINELARAASTREVDRLLDRRIVHGMYPEAVLSADPEAVLGSIAENYLFRDILAYEGIRKPRLVESLVKLLAVSVGSEVSFTELANTLDVSRQTIESYVSILEQAFIVFSVTPFHENLRSELTKKRKIYFCDTGIRNAILDAYQSDMDTRTDTGALFENFVFAEMRKKYDNAGKRATLHFWRTHDGQEVDLIAKEAEAIVAHEIKWREQSYTAPPAWKAIRAVPVSLIHRGNCVGEFAQSSS